MNPLQQQAFDSEMAQAIALIDAGDIDGAFANLERAHVIGQAHVIPHVQSHWHMLRVYMIRGRAFAVFGQAIRIVFGALGSAVGVVPTGNTGGSDISMFKRMPIDPYLQAIIDGKKRRD
ncbi:MAG: DUF3703 domain-containing protein [Pseudomonadota bacterium]